MSKILYSFPQLGVAQTISNCHWSLTKAKGSAKKYIVFIKIRIHYPVVHSLPTTF